MLQYGFYINADKCITCKACVMACKDKNNLKPGFKFRKVYTITSGSWDKAVGNGGAYSYSVPVACNHCKEPICRSVCPAGAIVKRAGDGIVFIDKELCIGCGSCAISCPYHAPSWDKEAMKTDKCDFCRELVDIGEAPVCVTACSMGAIEYGDMSYLQSKHPGTTRQVYPLADPGQTTPSLLITMHRKSTGSESDATARIFNMPEELQAYEA